MPVDTTFSAAKIGARQKRVKTISRSAAVDWIKFKSGGTIFGVDLIKRTTGGARYMVCRYGVRSHAKGIGLSFDPTQKRLIVVWDMQKHSYRMIAIEGLRGILKRGEYFKVV